MTAFFRAHALALLLLGCSLFAGSAGLLYAHVLKIRTMRDVGFPIAAEVQPLLRRKAMLSEQGEIAKLQASARGSSYREIYDLYVLPEKADAVRTLATIETLLTHLRGLGIVRSIDGIDSWDADGSSADISLSVTAAPGGSAAILDLFDLSGVLTVNDAFTDAERERLLALTERENPAVIAAIEQFLGGDLLQYATVPQLAESQLFKAVGTERFETDFRALADSSRLRSFATTALLLDGADDSLWPLPLFTVESAHWEAVDGGERLTLRLRAHGKGDARP
jgi:hypothetical protein